MKKLLFSLGVLFIATASHATQDRAGSMRPALWRTTETCIVLNFVQLSTYAVHLHAVSVDSVAINSGGDNFLAVFNSTCVPNSTNPGNFLTTGTLTTTAFNGAGNAYNTPPIYVYDAYFSSGAVVNKKGTACTNIFWDTVQPVSDPAMPWRP